jgi:hypothetical protein
MISMLWSVVIILVSAVSAIVFPLTTYALTLATFGIAHVAIELRYIDGRFHRKFDNKIEVRLLQLVIAIALLRLASIFGVVAPNIAHLLELSCGLGLVSIATHQLWINNWRRGSILFQRGFANGLTVACLLGIGIIKDPIATSVIFAIVHNLTPIGFILDRQGLKSARTIWICGLIFGLLPLLIILCRSFSIVHLPIETNVSYLSAFVAPSWQKLPIAYPLFSAVAFLQCMHYATIIGLLSQWTPDRSTSLFQWLSSKYFYLLVGGISMCFLIAFQHSFVLTRAVYGVVASIHAWIEIPLLLLMLQPLEQNATSIRSQISTEG